MTRVPFKDIGSALKAITTTTPREESSSSYEQERRQLVRSPPPPAPRRLVRVDPIDKTGSAKFTIDSHEYQPILQALCKNTRMITSKDILNVSNVEVYLFG